MSRPPGGFYGESREDKLARVELHKREHGLVIRKAKPGELPPPKPRRSKKPSASAVNKWVKEQRPIASSTMPGS